MSAKKFYFCSVLLVVSFVVVSCVYYADGIVGKGAIVSQKLTVTSFTALKSASSANVEIAKGDSLEVILSDYENLLDYWDVKVIDNALVIQTRPFSSLVNSRAKVTVKLPGELYEAVVQGSGSLVMDSDFGMLRKVSLTGSGSITGNVNARYSSLSVSISGSGNVSLKGTADELKAVTTGSGKMRLSELMVQDVDCLITGSGDVYLTIEQSLKARIVGSGNIIYSGRPVIDFSGSGSGKLVHL